MAVAMPCSDCIFTGDEVNSPTKHKNSAICPGLDIEPGVQDNNCEPTVQSVTSEFAALELTLDNELCSTGCKLTSSDCELLLGQSSEVNCCSELFSMDHKLESSHDGTKLAECSQLKACFLYKQLDTAVTHDSSKECREDSAVCVGLERSHINTPANGITMQHKALHSESMECCLSSGTKRPISSVLMCAGAGSMEQAGKSYQSSGSGIPVLTGSNFTRWNRLDDSIKLRIRKAGDGPRRGPVVARHPVQTTATVEPTVTVLSKVASTPNRSRTPPPLLGPGLGEGSHTRKRSPSITRSRPSSPGSGSGRRPPSPGALEPAVLEAVRRRVRRVQKARLYLLQQPGPNSFLVGGDSPDHKYRVVIGPQSCSCGRGPHCLHLLFVMLRVFQVPENDYRIYAKELKNFEVETLFRHFQQRRNYRINVSPQGTRKEHPVSQLNLDVDPSPLVEGSSPSIPLSPSSTENKAIEEEICPICLLEMVDGESLVVCAKGCRNKLHHHCMAIWAAECTQQGDYVLCPLCRQPWGEDTSTFKTPCSKQNAQDSRYKYVPGTLLNSKLSSFSSVHLPHPMHLQPPGPGPGPLKTVQKDSGLVTWNRSPGALSKTVKKKQYLPLDKTELMGVWSTSELKENCIASSPNGLSCSVPVFAKSPTCVPLQEVSLPHTGPIPPEQMSIAAEWIRVFGLDLVSCLYSRDWKDREMALRRLVNDVITVHRSDNEEKQQKVTWCCAKILTMVVADPVFKVYLGCVRCFRVLVNCATCHNTYQREELQELFRPIIKTLLRKCADRNRRTSHLSAEVLVEMAKGQNGELALGRHNVDPVSWGLEGLELILSCVLENFTVDFVNWQWLAGRLLMLNTLLQLFPEEFSLKYVALHSNESGYKLSNFNRLLSVVEFSFKALQSSHSTVSKLARHVFILSSSMSTVEKGMLNQILEMISELDSNLQSRLRKRLQSAIENQNHINGLQKKSKLSRTAQVANIGVPANNNKNSKVEPQGPPSRCCSQMPSVVLTSPAVRPKDLPLELTPGKTRKIPKIVQVSNNSHTPTSKRWMNSGSKLSSLFSRNKKSYEVLPGKPELNAVLDTSRIVCGFEFPESPSTPLTDFTFNSIEEDDSVNFFTRVMSCIPNSQNDRSSCEKLNSFPMQIGEWPEKHEENLSDPIVEGIRCETPYVETLIRPVVGYSSIEKENIGDKMNMNTYIEDSHWKRGPLLGTGAYSTCFQARDVKTGRLMAVKQVPFCRNSAEEQGCVEAGIRKEIMTMYKLHHPNVLQILGATRQESHFNIFVEWMAGGSIAGILDNYGPFNKGVITEYTKQILEGLNYLHENHILHRDLKGANLLVDSTGKQLRIGDFGAAARLESQATVGGEFQGQLLGTIAFMAPEVLRGEDYGRSCDIWSVGCCIIEMATSKAPWRENRMSNHLALMYKIASSKDPPFIPDVLGPAVKDLALNCLQLKAELRPTAKELLSHFCFKVLDSVHCLAL